MSELARRFPPPVPPPSAAATASASPAAAANAAFATAAGWDFFVVEVTDALGRIHSEVRGMCVCGGGVQMFACGGQGLGGNPHGHRRGARLSFLSLDCAPSVAETHALISLTHTRTYERPSSHTGGTAQVPAGNSRIGTTAAATAATSSAAPAAAPAAARRACGRCSRR